MSAISGSVVFWCFVSCLCTSVRQTLKRTMSRATQSARSQRTHWAPGLQAQVAFLYQLPTETSTMGGGVWQDNFDGSYTQLRDFYFVPAPGYLYLMGLIPAAAAVDPVLGNHDRTSSFHDNESTIDVSVSRSQGPRASPPFE